MTSQLPGGDQPSGAHSPGLGRVGGIPTELLAAALLFAVPAIYVLVDALRGLPDIIDLFGFSARFGFLILWLFLIVIAIAVGLIAIAWLVLRVDPVGRGLAYLVAGEWVVATIAAKQRTTAELVTMVCLMLSAIVLAVSPVLQASFRHAKPRQTPTSLDIARILLVVSASLLSSIGLVYLIAALGLQGGGKYTALGVIFLLAGPGAFVGSQYLAQRHRPARAVITAIVAGVFILGLILGGRSFGEVQVLSLMLVIPICLWLTPDAREYFGDPPLQSLTAAHWGFPGSPQHVATPYSAATGTVNVASPSTPHVVPLTSVTCAHCHATIDPDDSFCSGCGSPIAHASPTGGPDRRCVGCTNELGESDVFCPRCGQASDLGADEPVTKRVCSSCATALAAEDRFCFSCGQPA